LLPALLQLLAAVVLIAVGAGWDQVGWVAYRAPWLPVAAIASVLLAILIVALRRRYWLALLLPALLAIWLNTGWWASHAWQRQQVLRADPALAQSIGRHFIVGYTDAAELDLLIERGLIGGVFLTKRNLVGLDAAGITRLTTHWQTLSQQHGYGPLLIATDQEGGIVARLSPPLPKQPPLGRLLAAGGDTALIANTYGKEQGSGLQALGINLNFAPVVDLDHGVDNPDDRYSRISSRALASDPATVVRAADAYCAALASYRVRCTLKHFPGLGRVFEDTHADSATITTPLAELQRSDLLPFQTLMQRPDIAVMLTHARLAALDATYPVSSSTAVVQQLLRQQWHFNGLLVTDDLSMAAAREQAGGLPLAVRRSLNAGVDVQLVSWDPALYYPLLAALIEDARSGRLDTAALQQSTQRLTRMAGGRPVVLPAAR
jgi:beta-N-acetylhexosaminidase